MNHPNPQAYPQPPHGQAPAPLYGAPPAQQAPQAAAKKKGKPPVLSFLFAIGACGLGFITFLIAGFRGHSAGWEMMAVPTLATFVAATIPFVGAIITAASDRRYGAAVALLGMSFLACVLAAIGFVLGA